MSNNNIKKQKLPDFLTWIKVYLTCSMYLTKESNEIVELNNILSYF